MSQLVRTRAALEQIARRMWLDVMRGQRPYQYTQLRHGLEVLLERKGGTLRLGLARNAPHRPTDVLNHAQPLAFRG
jgi:hypothetical protein